MTVLPRAEVEVALLREKWEPAWAARCARDLPFRVVDTLPEGIGGMYRGGTDAYVDLAPGYIDKTLSHEAMHWWDDVGDGIDGIDLAAIEAHTEALIVQDAFPMAQQAAWRTRLDAVGDVVHWGHFIWDRIGQDVRNLPVGYARARLPFIAGALALGTVVVGSQINPGVVYRVFLPMVAR